MSEYYVKPNVLRSQADALWSNYISMRSLTAEISPIIRVLQQQTNSFDDEIYWLKKVCKKAEEQYEALFRTSRTLDSVAESYTRHEQQVINRRSGSGSVTTGSTARSVQRSWNTPATSSQTSAQSQDSTTWWNSAQVSVATTAQSTISPSVVSLFSNQSESDGDKK